MKVIIDQKWKNKFGFDSISKAESVLGHTQAALNKQATLKTTISLNIMEFSVMKSLSLDVSESEL